MENKKAWSGKTRGGTFGYAFFILLIRRIGIGAAYAFLAFVALYFIPFAPKATRASWHYHRRILGCGRWRSAWRVYLHFYRFGQVLIDKVAILNGMSGRYRFSFEEYEPFLKNLQSGAVVMIGAHVGCWEIGSTFFGDYASKLNVVMFDAEYERIKEMIHHSGEAYKIIPVNEGGLESLLRIKQAVDQGEAVCFQGDRYVGEEHASAADFMGRKALFPKGPFTLASKFRTPVVFYFAMREGRSYRFIFKNVEAGKSADELLAIYLTELERVVRRYPEQWFNFFELWR